MRRSFRSSAVAAAAILASLLLTSSLWSAIRRHLERQQRDAILRGSLERQNQDLAAALQHALDEAASTLQEAARRAQQEQSDFAYAFYATNDEYACGALVNIQRLHHLGARYPIHVLVSPDVSHAYRGAFGAAGARIHVETPPALPDGTAGYYADCLLKLLVFKLHRISAGVRRVLAFDSDQLILQNLDPLFTGLPRGSISAPRAYWIAKDFLASTFMMIDLSDRLWDEVHAAVTDAGVNEFDMDIINRLLGGEVTMLSGSYITLNSHWEDWNLPSWYHSESAQQLNWTTIARVNALAKWNVQATQELAPDSSFRPPASEDHVRTARRVRAPSTAGMPTRAGIDDRSGVQQVVAKPRFPEHHPLWHELYALQSAAALIHFTAIGKPWTVTPEILRTQRPDAHPLLGEQFSTWRTAAEEVCPGFASRSESARAASL